MDTRAPYQHVSSLWQRNIKLPGGCHKGELTKLGQEQARDVGDWLRQRYVQDLSFLPAQYEVGCIAVYNDMRLW